MKPFPIPVVAFGPGSQADASPRPRVVSPGEMAVFRRPVPRPAASPESIEGARRRLERLLGLMEQGAHRTGTACISVLDAEPGEIEQVNELLGHGEVSILIRSPRRARIQETAFAGIWRVQTEREDGSLLADEVEAGPMPRSVREALAGLRAPVVSRPDAEPGVMNAPAILGELLAASAAWRPGADPHIVNLTLLPVSPEDLAFLAERLGAGPVTMLSRGYGNCRVTSTALPHTWWVQFFNSQDQLILNTIEVTAVPEVAQAADEDLELSIRRLREWLTTL
jgi:hydrogenase-1 operon protein HyaF